MVSNTIRTAADLRGYIAISSCYSGFNFVDNVHYIAAKFPRTDAQKEMRMDKMVNWRLRQLEERRIRHIKFAFLVGGALLVGTPLVLTVVTFLWHLAFDVMLG